MFRIMKNNLSNRLLFLFSVASVGLGVMGFYGPSRHMESDPPQRFDYLVREDMFAGFRGDSSALHRAMTLCEDTLRANPNHSQALVWHGCAIWYLSGQAFQSGDFQKGMALSDSGMGEMDRAVELDSNNVAVRIPRGAAILAAAPYLPEPNRTILLRKGLADYERTY